jgi:RNA polymerase sigma factor (sigma-70 family)
MNPADGFEQFVHSRANDLRRLAFLLTSNQSDADRLVETVLATCLARWSRIDKAGDAYAQARSMLLAASRPRRPAIRRPAIRRPAIRRPTVADAALGNPADIRDEFRRALPGLRGSQRRVVVLRYFEGLSEDDTAATLDCSLAAVRRHEKDALDRIRTAAAGVGQPPTDLVRRAHRRLRARRRARRTTAVVIAGLVVAGIAATSSHGPPAAPQALATGGTVPQSAVTTAPYVAPPLRRVSALPSLPRTANLALMRTLHGTRQLWLYDATTVKPLRALAAPDGGGATTGPVALDPDRNDRVVFVRDYTMRSGGSSPDDAVELRAWRLYEVSILTHQTAALTNLRVGAPPDELLFSPQGHRLAIVTGTSVEIMNTYDDGVGHRFLSVPRRFSVIGFLAPDGPLLTSYIRPTGGGSLPDVQLVTAIDIDDPSRTNVIYTSDTTRCEPTQQAWGTPSGHLVLRTRCPVTLGGTTRDVLGFFAVDDAGAHLIAETSLAVGYVPRVTWTSTGDAIVEEFDGSCGLPPVVDRVTMTGTRTRISGRFAAGCHR